MPIDTAHGPDLDHHGDAEVGAGLVDLAVNVRAGTPPAWLRSVLSESLHDPSRYPDGMAARSAVALRHGRRAEEVLLTAGAAEAFVLLARALTPRRAVVVHPQFTAPEAAFRAAGHAVERVVLEAADGFRLAVELIPDDADLVLVGNPTNPTSVLHPASVLASLARPGRVLVVDEAFADTVPAERESLAGRSDLPGLVVVRSLTKTWGLAGIRAGYLLASADLVARLGAAQPPWPVSTPALAATFACSSQAAVAEAAEWARTLAADREHLVAGLRDRGFDLPAESASSFVLARRSDAAAVCLRARSRGFAIRRGDTFPGLGPEWLRFAVRDRTTLDAALGALDEPGELLRRTVEGIRPLDAGALHDGAERQDRLTKPPGSLGVLEEVAMRLCGLAGTCPPPQPRRPAVAVFAADHGVHAQGVTPWPQEVTAQMVANFLAGGAVVNAFAAQVDANVVVVDVGVASPLEPVEGLVSRRFRAGTADMTVEPAMTRVEALEAVEAGIRVALDLVAAGHDLLVTGDMGIANTTASAALVAVFTGHSARETTGRGTGVDDETLERKIAVIESALHRHSPSATDAIGALSAVGGLEHAALAGYLLGASFARVPVVLDGVIACAAALAAARLAAQAPAGWIAGHRSAEPGAGLALTALGLVPLVDLGLRLGEGTGALLAVPLVQSAVRALREVATFDSAGVTGKAGNRDPG